MHRDLDLLRPKTVALSWLLAAASYPLALVFAACGQGLGAVAGGCRWIGLTVPLHRQVWALVVEPLLPFASLPRAWPYWLGSLLLPLAVAALAVPLLPRGRTLAGELAVLQIAWGADVAAVAMEPLLDANDGHLARFLHFRHLAPELRWLAPAAAAGVAVIPALRLLALLREGQPHPSRIFRLATVLIHLVAPAAAWVLAVHVAGGRTPWEPAVGTVLPVAVALGLAWAGVPPRLGHRLQAPVWRNFLAALAAAVAVWAVVVIAGRPLPQGRTAGVLWGRRAVTDNVRPWVAPQRLIWPGRR